VGAVASPASIGPDTRGLLPDHVERGLAVLVLRLGIEPSMLRSLASADVAILRKIPSGRHVIRAARSVARTDQAVHGARIATIAAVAMMSRMVRSVCFGHSAKAHRFN